MRQPVPEHAGDAAAGLAGRDRVPGHRDRLAEIGGVLGPLVPRFEQQAQAVEVGGTVGVRVRYLADRGPGERHGLGERAVVTGAPVTVEHAECPVRELAGVDHCLG